MKENPENIFGTKLKSTKKKEKEILEDTLKQKTT